MRPALDQLEALLWIARLGSFRGAARKLSLSQPAVSGRIRELENQLGFAVLDRTSFRPQVTEKGLDIVRYAEQMIGLAENLRERLAEREPMPSTIRMGAADTYALTHLSPLLMRIAVRHPGTRVDLDVDYSANLDAKLREGRLDIAFLTAPQGHPEVTIEPLLDLELAWLASPKLALPRGRPTPADLKPLPIITNPRPSHLYRTVHEWFAGAGLVPERLHTCTSLTIMAKLTMRGFGLSVLPPVIVRREISRGSLVRVRSSPALPPHHIAVAYRNDAARGDLKRIADLAKSLRRWSPRQW